MDKTKWGMIVDGRWWWVGWGKMVVGKWRQLYLNINKNLKIYFKRKVAFLSKYIIHQSMESITESQFKCVIAPRGLRKDLAKYPHFMNGKPEFQTI